MTREITVVRHAESEANQKGILSGATPSTPLTDLGHKQAMEAAHQLARTHQHGRPIKIITSPYVRTHQTALHLAHALLIPKEKIEPSHELRERSFGVLEGRPVEFQKVPGYILKRGGRSIRADEHYRPEGGESLEDVRQRVAPAVDQLLKKYPNHRLVIVAHAHVIKALHAHAQGGWEGKIPRAENADIHTINWPARDVVESADPNTCSWCHVPGAHPSYIITARGAESSGGPVGRVVTLCGYCSARAKKKREITDMKRDLVEALLDGDVGLAELL